MKWSKTSSFGGIIKRRAFKDLMIYKMEHWSEHLPDQDNYIAYIRNQIFTRYHQIEKLTETINEYKEFIKQKEIKLGEYAKKKFGNEVFEKALEKDDMPDLDKDLLIE